MLPGLTTLGIIPANTGRMIRHKPHIKVDRDHPREYGENLSKTDEVAGKQGSSPRIRGECATSAAFQRPKRIIPANTGRISYGSWITC